MATKKAASNNLDERQQRIHDMAAKLHGKTTAAKKAAKKADADVRKAEAADFDGHGDPLLATRGAVNDPTSYIYDPSKLPPGNRSASDHVDAQDNVAARAQPGYRAEIDGYDAELADPANRVVSDNDPDATKQRDPRQSRAGEKRAARVSRKNRSPRPSSPRSRGVSAPQKRSTSTTTRETPSTS